MMRYNSEKSLCGHSFNDDILFTVEDIEYSVVCLRNGKACGADGSSKENIVYSYPALIVHLKLLLMCVITVVLYQINLELIIIIIIIQTFVRRTLSASELKLRRRHWHYTYTIHLVKDKLGNINSINNYRPITLRPVISKIFEYCALNKFESQLVLIFGNRVTEAVYSFSMVLFHPSIHPCVY